MPRIVKGAKNRTIEAVRATEVQTAVQGLTFEKVSTKIAAVGLEVQRSLANIGSTVAERLQELQNIDAVLALRKDELERLHGIKVEATTLDELRAEHQAVRDSWQAEERERNQKWTRDEKEYAYNLARKREQEKDEYQAQYKEREEDLLAKEAAFAEKAEELEMLRETAATYPEKEAKAQARIQALELKIKDMETAAKIREAEHASALKSVEITLNAEVNRSVRLEHQVSDLKDQLAEANASVKEISSKALEASAGREALDRLQKVAENIQSPKGK